MEFSLNNSFRLELTQMEYTSSQPLGIVAGRGKLPFEVCRLARKNGVDKIIAVAVKTDTSSEIVEIVDEVVWLHVGQLRKMIDYFQVNHVENVMFAGQIKPSHLFTGIRPDAKALKILWGLSEKNAHSIFTAVVEALAANGITVLPSTTFLDEIIPEEGVLGKHGLDKKARNDIELGARVAREIGRLDIGQTVVVKNGTVLAVEGFEGTDEAIKRGGELGKGGVTVVKLAKPQHDIRFDVPCVGMQTLDSLQQARAKTLVVHAGKTLILQREQFITNCDRAGIAVYGLNCPDSFPPASYA